MPCSGPCGPGMRRPLPGSMPGLTTICPGPGPGPSAVLALGPAARRLLGGAGCQHRQRRRPGLRPGPGPGGPRGLAGRRRACRITWRRPGRVQAAILAKEVVALPGRRRCSSPRATGMSRAALPGQSLVFFPGGVSACLRNFEHRPSGRR